jgi:hypothetical protein
MSNYCLKPVPIADLKTLLGPTFINTFQNEIDLIVEPLRKHVAKGRRLMLAKEIWECVVADSIVGADWVGAGKSIDDVKITEDISCDVKSVQINNKITSEASMFQPLISKKIVSDFFETKNSLGLWNTYVNGWFKKVSSINEYYLLIIVRDKITNSCSIGAFKVDKNAVLQYNVSECKFNSKTMVIDSLADPKLLDIKIYDTKTRMEIKIKEEFYNDPKYCYQIYQFDKLGKYITKEEINE